MSTKEIANCPACKHEQDVISNDHIRQCERCHTFWFGRAKEAS